MLAGLADVPPAWIVIVWPRVLGTAILSMPCAGAPGGTCTIAAITEPGTAFTELLGFGGVGGFPPEAGATAVTLTVACTELPGAGNPSEIREGVLTVPGSAGSIVSSTALGWFGTSSFTCVVEEEATWIGQFEPFGYTHFHLTNAISAFGEPTWIVLAWCSDVPATLDVAVNTVGAVRAMLIVSLLVAYLDGTLTTITAGVPALTVAELPSVAPFTWATTCWSGRGAVLWAPVAVVVDEVLALVVPFFEEPPHAETSPPLPARPGGSRLSTSPPG